MADVAVTGGNGAKAFDTKAFDTRSFIMSRAALQDTPVRSRLQLQETGDLVRPGLPRTVQARYTRTHAQRHAQRHARTLAHTRARKHTSSHAHTHIV